jgi:hypothetical protein
LRRYSLAAGLVLMFAFTWPIDLAWAGRLPFKVPFPLYLFLGWGFIAAALLMTGLTDIIPSISLIHTHWRQLWSSRSLKSR